jgi:hypothetical protein
MWGRRVRIGGLFFSLSPILFSEQRVPILLRPHNAYVVARAIHNWAGV